MIYGNQVRAARGLLDWTVLDLSAKSGLQPNTITAFENSTRPATAETVTRLTQALEMAGIEFTPTGVQMASPIYELTGPNMYRDLLDDVLRTKAEEVLIENADETITPPDIIEKFREVKKQGISVRMTIEEGNCFMMHAVSHYRWIPKKHFQNWVIMTYGSKVAIVVNSDPKNLKSIIISQEKLADTMRNRFNFVWDLLKPLDIESTAHERIL